MTLLIEIKVSDRYVKFSDEKSGYIIFVISVVKKNMYRKDMYEKDIQMMITPITTIKIHK